MTETKEQPIITRENGFLNPKVVIVGGENICYLVDLVWFSLFVCLCFGPGIKYCAM